MTTDVDDAEHVGRGALLLNTDSREGELSEVSVRIPRELVERLDEDGVARFRPTRTAPWVTLVVEDERDLWEETGENKR